MTATGTARCRLCGSGEGEVVRRSLRNGVRRRVLRCRRCGLVYLSHGLPQATYVGKAYRAQYGPKLRVKATPSDLFSHYLPFQHQIYDRIQHLLRHSTKILDVGCSTGHFLHSLKRKVGTRVGLELNQGAVRFIRRNLDFRVYDQPLEALEIPEGPFDVITALQVLEHTEAPVEFLRALRRHLKPGGHVYIEVPNVEDVLLTQYGVEAYEEFYYREAHLSYFSRRTLAKAAAKAGFKGRTESVQRYSFRNHMNWLLAGAPQSAFAEGNQPASLVDGPKRRTAAGRQLNEFMRRADEEYKQLVGKAGLGESVTFLGA